MPSSIQHTSGVSAIGGRFHSVSCSRRRPLGSSVNRECAVPSQRSHCSTDDVTPNRRSIQRPYWPPGL